MQNQCAKVLTKATGVFIAVNMQPYSVIENTGFKHMVKVLELDYNMFSDMHFSRCVCPAAYK